MRANAILKTLVVIPHIVINMQHSEANKLRASHSFPIIPLFIELFLVSTEIIVGLLLTWGWIRLKFLLNPPGVLDKNILSSDFYSLADDYQPIFKLEEGLGWGLSLGYRSRKNGKHAFKPIRKEGPEKIVRDCSCWYFSFSIGLYSGTAHSLFSLPSVFLVETVGEQIRSENGYDFLMIW